MPKQFPTFYAMPEHARARRAANISTEPTQVQLALMSSSIPRYSANLRGRDWAVGDIHGCFARLKANLDAAGFNPDVDRLFSVGDLVDRGPESHEVITWLDKPWFHAICGNHDFMAWRTALGNPYSEVDHVAHGGGWLLDLPLDERERIGNRLKALPYAIEIETQLGDIGLVHADCPWDDWAGMQQMDWANLSDIGPIKGCCLWSLERHQRQYAGIVKNIRAVVHGHVTVPVMQVMGNVHFIDTGGWRESGYFTLLDLATLKSVPGIKPPKTARRRLPEEIRR